MRASRYVEVSYELATEDHTRFYAVLIHKNEAPASLSPTLALTEAKKRLLRAHPGALRISEFMQRLVEDDRYEQIEKEIRAGTWTGWEFEKANG